MQKSGFDGMAVAVPYDAALKQNGEFMQATDDTVLFDMFGTANPEWTLHGGSDVLCLSDVSGAVVQELPLTASQATQIRNLSGSTSTLRMALALQGRAALAQLVGSKSGQQEWRGRLASVDDAFAVARDLEIGLNFAEQVVSEVSSLVCILDYEGRIKRFNRLCEEFSGFKEIDLIGMNGHALFAFDDVHDDARTNILKALETETGFRVERSIKTLQGVRRVAWNNKVVRCGSGPRDKYLVCSGVDVTEERRAQERLATLATTDVLTGLPNRHAIQEHIAGTISGDEERRFAIMFLDLDNFKNINDHYGHLTGDLLLQEAGKAVRGCLREGDRLARLGGDEFLVMVMDDGPGIAEGIAEQIVQRMRQPFQLGLVQAYSGCSIGIARFPEHGMTREELIRNADTALYVAKGAGRQTYRLFKPAMNAKVRESLWLDTNLRRALDNNEFELHYQPKIDLQTGDVCSVEALIRWNSLERGEVQPNQFIAYAEESGLIVPMAKWVMRTAAAQAAKWKEQGLDLRVAVNLSARNFLSETVVEDFVNSLKDAGLMPCMLDIELTESCLLADEDAAREMIIKFRELGAEVHLDDFGTGYSSLSQLTRLPLDVIKLDRSFICPTDKSPRARAIVRAVVAVAQELECRIVAEGVETTEQADFLRKLGVENAQGFLFGRPMCAADFDAWHSSRQVLAAVA